MKKWMDLLCMLLLAGMAAAQSNMSLPAGTAMMVKLETTLATFSNKSGDPFQGRITQPVTLNGKTLIPVGATVLGHVTSARAIIEIRSNRGALPVNRPLAFFLKLLCWLMANAIR